MAKSSHRPGELPEIHDEAGPTPTWLPLSGLALAALIMLAVVARSAMGDDAPAVEIVVGDVLPEAAPAPAPEPEPEAEPAAPAGETDAFGRSPGDEHFGHDHE